MDNYVGNDNPFRNKATKLLQQWLHHVQMKSHRALAKELYDLAVLAKKKEKIWDLTNQVSESCTP